MRRGWVSPTWRIDSTQTDEETWRNVSTLSGTLPSRYPKRAEMHSSSWMNGHVGAASQAATGRSFRSLGIHEGAVINVPAWQTSVAPYQTPSFLQPTGENHQSCGLIYLNSGDNADSRSCRLQYSNQAPVQQQPHPVSAVNAPTPSGVKAANAAYAQQDVSLYWNQAVNGMSPQDGRFVADRQRYGAQRAAHPDRNGRPNAAGASLPRKQAAYAGSPRRAHAGQTQNPRRQEFREGPRSPPPRYSEYMSRLYRQNGNEAPPAGSQAFNLPPLNQSSQQCAPQLNRTHNAWAETPPAVKSSTHSRQCAARNAPSGVNERLLHYPPEAVGRSYANETNQAVQQACHSNGAQIVPPPPRQRLPHSDRCGVTSGAQPTERRPPQQNGAAAGVSTTGDRGGRTSDCALGSGTPVGSSPAASQQTQQKNEAQASAANATDVLAPGNPGDGPVHSSPGRAGARAVAVVQPLSQEKRSVADEPLGRQDKDADVAVKRQTARSGESVGDAKKPKGFPAKHPAAFGRSTARNGLLRKLLIADRVPPSVHALCMQNVQASATPTQESVTLDVPIGQNGEKCESEMPAGLSSIAVTSWTVDMLSNKIQAEEMVQSPKDHTQKSFNSVMKQTFSKLEMNDYKSLMSQVKEFLKKHVTTDSVVLSQVKTDSANVLERFRVLRDDEDHPASAYNSSWLNVNPELDDIDKEFGFPWSLKRGLTAEHRHRSERKDEAVGDAPEEPNDHQMNTGLEAVDSCEDEQESTVLTTSNQTFSPNNSDGDGTNDAYYAFEIQVLSPEEAKRVFQLVKGETTQSLDLASRSEEATGGSGDVEATNVTTGESGSSLEHICCTTRSLSESLETDCADETSHEGNDELRFSSSEAESAANGAADEAEPTPSPEELGDPRLDDRQQSVPHASTNDSLANGSEDGAEGIQSAEASPSRNSDISDNNIQNVARQRSEDEEDCAPDKLTSPSLEPPTEEPQSIWTPALQAPVIPRDERKAAARKRKKTDCIERRVLKSNDLKKSKLSSDKNRKTAPHTVELALFGSAARQTRSRKKSVSSPEGSSIAGQTAPKILAVNVSPPGTKAGVYPGPCSVKERIHEEWRRSFPPTKIKRNGKEKEKVFQCKVTEDKNTCKIKLSAVDPRAGPTSPQGKRFVKFRLSSKKFKRLSVG